MFVLKKIFWLTRNTFTEAVRQKFFSFVLILCVGLMLVSLSLTSFDFGNSELKFIADFGFGGLFLFGSVLAVVMTVQLFFTEIENRTALTLLAKPVRRTEFLCGKFLGVWLLLGIFVALICIVLALVLWMRAGTVAAIAEARGTEMPFLSFGGIAIFAVLQWFRLGIVVALTMAVSSFAQTYLYAVVISFCGVLVGQLRYVFPDFADSGKAGEAAKIFAVALSKIIPDLQMFNVGQTLVLDPAGLPAGTVFAALACGAIWIVACLAVAVWFFRFREI